MISLATIGHNKASPAEIASGALDRLRSFLAETPVIETLEQAKAGAQLAASISKTLADIEDDRDALVRPLNQQVRDINAEFKAATSPVAVVVAELKARLTAYAEAEEARRREETIRLYREVFEANARAREAAQRQAEAAANAKVGEVGADWYDATVAADAAAADVARAERAAARAERDTGVRISNGFGKATSLRSREILSIIDPVAAVGELGLSPNVEEAIRKDSAAFRKLKGRLPAGVTSHTERSI